MKFLVFVLSGIAAALLGLVLTYAVSAPGSYPVEANDLPREAQEIIAANPGKPLSKSDLGRINEILGRHDPGRGQQMLVADLTSGWYWFALFPVLLAMLAVRRGVQRSGVVAMSTPCLIVLVYFIVLRAQVL
jgi:hypothetical protein